MSMEILLQMVQTQTNIYTDFGSDFKLDQHFNPLFAANGEAIMVEGSESAAQDIAISLKTPIGSLFYDNEFGSKLSLYAEDEDSDKKRMNLCIDINDTINSDPRVEYNSTYTQVDNWELGKITASCNFYLNDEAVSYRIEIGKTVEFL